MASAGQHKATVILDGKADGMNKAAQTASKNVGSLESQVERLEAQLAKANARIDAFASKNERAANSAKKSGGQISTAWHNFNNVVSSVQGTIGVAQQAADMIDRVAERSFHLDNVQANLPFSIEAARKATQGLVSDYDLMRQAIAANRLGVAKTEKDFARAAEAAVKLGVAAGGDAAQSLDDFVNGLGRGSTEVLDNLGIMLRAEEAYKVYAAQLGKTAAELTDVEKRQAVISVGMERGIEMASKSTIVVDGWAGAWERAKISISNTADAIVDLDDNMSDLAKEGLLEMGLTGQQADRAIDNLGTSLKEGFLDFVTFGQASTVRNFSTAVDDLGGGVEELDGSIERGAPRWTAFHHFLSQSGTLAERAEKTISDLGRAIEQGGNTARLDMEMMLREIEELEGAKRFEDQRALREKIFKEAEKDRKDAAKKATADRQALVEAEHQINVDGARRDLEVMRSQLGDREATSHAIIDQIQVVAAVEREAAESRLRYAKNEADVLRIVAQVRAIDHGEQMAMLEERTRDRERAAEIEQEIIDKTIEQAEATRSLALAEAEVAQNRALRSADLIDDPIARMEAEAQARLELIDVQIRAANDPIEAMMLADEREQQLHELKIARIEEGRAAEEAAMARRVELYKMGAAVAEGYAGALIDAAFAGGHGVRAALAAESKVMARRHAMIAVSETLKGFVALASFNPMAAQHFQNAGTNAAFAVSLGGIAGAMGAFGGRTKKVDGFGASEFGGGAGPGASGGRPGSAPSSSNPNPLPNSPSPAPTTAGSSSAPAAAPGLVLNFNAPFAGSPKAFAMEVDKELRGLGYVGGRARA